MAASNVFIFFDDVLPGDIKKHGGISSEALRKAAAEPNIAVGGTLMAVSYTHLTQPTKRIV